MVFAQKILAPGPGIRPNAPFSGPNGKHASLDPFKLDTQLPCPYNPLIRSPERGCLAFKQGAR